MFSLVPHKSGILILLCYAIAVSSVLLLGAFIHQYSVNAFLLDDWETTFLLDKLHSHKLTFADVWSQHCEHRMLFPNLLFLATYMLFHWNNVTLNYESFFFALIAFAFLIGIIRRTFNDPLPRALITVSSAALFFSLAQWFNWFTGFDLQWFTLLSGTIGCIYLLSGSGQTWPRLFGAATLATFATYSLANGLTLWWVVLFVMLIEYKKWNIWMLGAWAFMGAVVCGFFFDGWHPYFQADPHYWIHHSKIFVEYTFAFLGNPFADRFLRVDILIGVIGCLLFALDISALTIMCRQKDVSIWPKGASWLIIILSSMASAVICAMARCPFGIPQALSSRYVTEGNLFWIGLAGFTWWLYNESAGLERKPILFKSTVPLWILASALLVAFVGTEYRSRLVIQDQTYLEDEAFIAECNNLQAPTALLAEIYPGVDPLKTRVAIALQLKQGPFCNAADVNAAVLYFKSSQAIVNGNCASAIPGLQTAESRLINFSVVHYKLAYCYYRTDRTDDASRELNQAGHLNRMYKFIQFSSSTPVPPLWQEGS